MVVKQEISIVRRYVDEEHEAHDTAHAVNFNDFTEDEVAGVYEHILNELRATRDRAGSKRENRSDERDLF